LRRLAGTIRSKHHARPLIREFVSVGDLPSTLKSLLREFRLGGDLEVHERVDLGAWTTLAIGGLGDLLIRCSTASAGQRAIDLLASHGLRWMVVGAGSRIVAPDRGLRIPLLHLAGELQRWTADGDGLVIGAGAKLAQVGSSLARSGAPELEPLVGEPGSAGGDLRAAAGGEPSALIGAVDWIEVARPGRERPRRAVREQRVLDGWPAEGRAVITRARLRTRGEPPSRAAECGLSRPDGRSARCAVGWRRSLFHDLPGSPSAARSCLLRGVAFRRRAVADWSPNAIVTTAACSARDVAGSPADVGSASPTARGVELTCRLWFVDELGRNPPLEPMPGGGRSLSTAVAPGTMG
jgi:UDP-N-acetylmuramate dehydrogenase